jgi:hypothetical protein
MEITRMSTSTLEQEPWSYCNVQRGDGMSCGDDVELLYIRKACKVSSKK